MTKETYQDTEARDFREFSSKRVLITGHTGFKGSWLAVWLQQMGAEVLGVSLKEPISNPSHFSVIGLENHVTNKYLDLRSYSEISAVVSSFQPDYIFHLAAQALVRRSYADPRRTYGTNLMGSMHVLESVSEMTTPCRVIMITSDKVYKNHDWLWGYRENDAIGGDDPYSASKSATELMINSYIKSFFPIEGNVRIAIARAGNVIGGGDWAVDRIVPDCVQRWGSGESVRIRKANATRPWQHVLEPLSGYLKLALALNADPTLHSEAFNFGPDTAEEKTVGQLVSLMSEMWPGRAKYEIETNPDCRFQEATLLKLNCDKAGQILKWRPTLTFSETVSLTTEWYSRYYSNTLGMAEITREQIRQYVATTSAKDNV